MMNRICSMHTLCPSIVLLIVLVSLVCSSALAITTKIEARSRFCITETVAPDVPLNFQFQVVAGGKLDINCEVFSGASMEKIYSWNLASHGEIKMKESQNPIFKICFSNEMAQFTPKWVNFILVEGSHPEAASVGQLDPLEAQVGELSLEMDKVLASQLRLRRAEHDHRNTVEDANNRVLMWSIFEGLTLILMGITQIFFLKRFLEVRATV